ncbi:MAG: hypothetical protein HC918_08660 [Oscillatoriales cyanobacterium SM2_1_8]|nr:hypothetical protein [Oscillatoriales cyanobacterium SM2_1_8]
MLPLFASRPQTPGAKGEAVELPSPRPQRDRPRRADVDCSERPEPAAIAQVAPPPFWQDLQKGVLPKTGAAAPPRKRVTAFAAIQLPDFPPLRS